ncbi:hypothetical protein [Streptomyces cinereoruber]|uniref:hypothetical protein n=1 Tax=Streptomyces cinereoruber TaxID=67260 RepID=UPI00362FEA84
MIRTAPRGVRLARSSGLAAQLGTKAIMREQVERLKDHAKGELTATPAAWSAFTAFARTCTV